MTKRQQEIPGTERPSIPEIDEVAGEYTEALYERMRLQTVEKQAREVLTERMREHGQTVYRYVDGEHVHDLELDEMVKLRCKRHEVAEEA